MKHFHNFSHYLLRRLLLIPLSATRATSFMSCQAGNDPTERPANPLCTIQMTADLAKPGDVSRALRVFTGTHRLPPRRPFNEKQSSFIELPGEKSISRDLKSSKNAKVPGRCLEDRICRSPFWETSFPMVI